MRTLSAHKIVTCLLFLLTVGFVATYGGAQRGAAQTKATTNATPTRHLRRTWTMRLTVATPAECATPR